MRVYARVFGRVCVCVWANVRVVVCSTYDVRPVHSSVYTNESLTVQYHLNIFIFHVKIIFVKYFLSSSCERNDSGATRFPTRVLPLLSPAVFYYLTVFPIYPQILPTWNCSLLNSLRFRLKLPGYIKSSLAMNPPSFDRPRPIEFARAYTLHYSGELHRSLEIRLLPSYQDN